MPGKRWIPGKGWMLGRSWIDGGQENFITFHHHLQTLPLPPDLTTAWQTLPPTLTANPLTAQLRTPFDCKNPEPF